MVKHFILNLNPQAQFEWERCALHHPITAEQPDFAQLLATNLSTQTAGLPKSGSYLIAVNIEVTILETNATETVAPPLTNPIVPSLTNPIVPRLTRTLAEVA
jgi:hypothetical protein